VRRWLNEDELQTWFALAGVMTWLPDALDAQLQRDAGISHFAHQVMAMLSMSPQRTRRMSDVGALANGSLTRLSRGHPVALVVERRRCLRRAARAPLRRAHAPGTTGRTPARPLTAETAPRRSAKGGRLRAVAP